MFKKILIANRGVILAHTSLRAKRGNPDFGSVAGLPCRFAPQNGGFLGALASWRETTLLFSSREAAKMRMNGEMAS